MVKYTKEVTRVAQDPAHGQGAAQHSDVPVRTSCYTRYGPYISAVRPTIGKRIDVVQLQIFIMTAYVHMS